MSHSLAIETAQEEQEIDLTPLIDCFLMLIIFFSCLEFRSLEAKLPAYLPKSVGRAPTDVPPEEVLSLRILGKTWGDEVPRYAASSSVTEPVPFRLVGHEVAWQLGAKRYDRISEVEPELRRIAKESTARSDARQPGGARPLPVVLEPLAGTTFADVALTLDAVLAAGFGEVRFGGGAGAAR